MDEKEEALTLFLAALTTVGSHLLSLESMRRKMASCWSMSCSSLATSACAFWIEEGLLGIG